MRITKNESHKYSFFFKRGWIVEKCNIYSKQAKSNILFLTLGVRRGLWDWVSGIVILWLLCSVPSSCLDKKNSLPQYLPEVFISFAGNRHATFTSPGQKTCQDPPLPHGGNFPPWDNLSMEQHQQIRLVYWDYLLEREIILHTRLYLSYLRGSHSYTDVRSYSSYQIKGMTALELLD